MSPTKKWLEQIALCLLVKHGLEGTKLVDIQMIMHNSSHQTLTIYPAPCYRVIYKCHQLHSFFSIRLRTTEFLSL